jgi:hypothetical protein
MDSFIEIVKFYLKNCWNVFTWLSIFFLFKNWRAWLDYATLTKTLFFGLILALITALIHAFTYHSIHTILK